MLKVEIVRVDVQSKKACKKIDYVAKEKPLHIFLNKTYYTTIFCSPSNPKELAIGHLLSSGILKSIEEIKEASMERKRTICRVKVTPSIDIKNRLKLTRPFLRVILSPSGSRPANQSGAGHPKTESTLAVKAEVLLNCVDRLNSEAKAFRKTGAVHDAAIYRSDGTLVAFAEDVGRHNAVDKVIGMAAANKIDFTECFLALSGRMSGEIVLKAARVGLPIVASLAAALDSGIRIAKETSVSLIGFVRGKGMNIYTFPERILLN